MLKSLLLGLIALTACGPAVSTELSAPPRWHAWRQQIVLPPERHTIEVVRPPYSGNFIINRTRFTAQSPACLGWTAGDRIVMRAGDWHGYCTEAVFYNVSRRSSCAMWCG